MTDATSLVVVLILKTSADIYCYGGESQENLHVDSRGLLDTISNLHDGKQYRLCQIVQRIRDSFKRGDIDVLRWLPTGQNIAEGINNCCPAVQGNFNIYSTDGTLTMEE